MAKKKNIKLFIVLGVLLILGYFLYPTIKDIGGGGERSKTITCDVTIFNPVWLPWQNGDVFIKSKSCRTAYVSGISCVFASINTFSIIPKDNVKVQLDVGGKFSSETVGITENTPKSLSITTKCIKESVDKGTITVTDETGKITDSEEVTL